MVRVQVRLNEPFEGALRRFKRQCNYSGIFRLAKKYSFHEKRSDRRRREGREKIRNIQRALRMASGKGRVHSVRKSRVRADTAQGTEETTGTAALAADAGVTEVVTSEGTATPSPAPADAPAVSGEAAPVEESAPNLSLPEVVPGTEPEVAPGTEPEVAPGTDES